LPAPFFLYTNGGIFAALLTRVTTPIPR
jgi:hypothetical protein